MQKNYVLQVLLVTLGFGVLLGLIAVIDTPQDWSQPTTSAVAPSGSLTGSGRPAAETTPSHAMSPRVVDFADKSESPSDDSSDDGQALPWHNCDHGGAAHKKACEDTNRPTRTGQADHC